MPKFGSGVSVRVNNEAHGVPPELWGKVGLIVNALPAPGYAQSPGQWEPAYEVRFQDLNRMYIIEERHLEALESPT